MKCADPECSHQLVNGLTFCGGSGSQKCVCQSTPSKPEPKEPKEPKEPGPAPPQHYCRGGLLFVAACSGCYDRAKLENLRDTMNHQRKGIKP